MDASLLTPKLEIYDTEMQQDFEAQDLWFSANHRQFKKYPPLRLYPSFASILARILVSTPLSTLYPLLYPPTVSIPVFIDVSIHPASTHFVLQDDSLLRIQKYIS